MKGGSLQLQELIGVLQGIVSAKPTLQKILENLVEKKDFVSIRLVAGMAEVFEKVDEKKVNEVLDELEKLGETSSVRLALKRSFEEVNAVTSLQPLAIIAPTEDDLREYILANKEQKSQQIAEVFGDVFTVKRIGQIRAGLSLRKPKVAKKTRSRKASKKSTKKNVRSRKPRNSSKNDAVYTPEEKGKLLKAINTIVDRGVTKTDSIHHVLEEEFGYRNVPGRTVAGVIAGRSRKKS